MIVIKVAEVTNNLKEREDFFKSLAAQASDSKNYRLSIDGDSSNSDDKIVITLPDNCLVLGKDWDKYINYALENDLPGYKDKDSDLWVYLTTWSKYVIRRMGLVGRPDNGIFPELKLEYLQSNDVNNKVATS